MKITGVKHLATLPNTRAIYDMFSCILSINLLKLNVTCNKQFKPILSIKIKILEKNNSEICRTANCYLLNFEQYLYDCDLLEARLSSQGLVHVGPLAAYIETKYTACWRSDCQENDVWLFFRSPQAVNAVRACMHQLTLYNFLAEANRKDFAANKKPIEKSSSLFFKS